MIKVWSIITVFHFLSLLVYLSTDVAFGGEDDLVEAKKALASLSLPENAKPLTYSEIYTELLLRREQDFRSESGLAEIDAKIQQLQTNYREKILKNLPIEENEIRKLNLTQEVLELQSAHTDLGVKRQVIDTLLRNDKLKSIDRISLLQSSLSSSHPEVQIHPEVPISRPLESTSVQIHSSASSGAFDGVIKVFNRELNVAVNMEMSIDHIQDPSIANEFRSYERSRLNYLRETHFYLATSNQVVDKELSIQVGISNRRQRLQLQERGLELIPKLQALNENTRTLFEESMRKNAEALLDSNAFEMERSLISSNLKDLKSKMNDFDIKSIERELSKVRSEITQVENSFWNKIARLKESNQTKKVELTEILQSLENQMKKWHELQDKFNLETERLRTLDKLQPVIERTYGRQNIEKIDKPFKLKKEELDALIEKIKPLEQMNVKEIQKLKPTQLDDFKLSELESYVADYEAREEFYRDNIRKKLEQVNQIEKKINETVSKLKSRFLSTQKRAELVEAQEKLISEKARAQGVAQDIMDTKLRFDRNYPVHPDKILPLMKEVHRNELIKSKESTRVRREREEKKKAKEAEQSRQKLRSLKEKEIAQLESGSTSSELEPPRQLIEEPMQDEAKQNSDLPPFDDKTGTSDLELRTQSDLPLPSDGSLSSTTEGSGQEVTRTLSDTAVSGAQMPHDEIMSKLYQEASMEAKRGSLDASRIVAGFCGTYPHALGCETSESQAALVGGLQRKFGNAAGQNLNLQHGLESPPLVPPVP